MDYTPLVPPSSFSFPHFTYFFWDQRKSDCVGTISRSACLGLCMNNYVLPLIFKVFFSVWDLLKASFNNLHSSLGSSLKSPYASYLVLLVLQCCFKTF